MTKRIIAALMLASLLSGSAPLALAAVAGDSARGHHSSTRIHSCCPGTHQKMVTSFTAAAMPCGNEHPCCAKHAPENPSSLPAVNRLPRPSIEVIVSRTTTGLEGGHARVVRRTARVVANLGLLRKTVLRI